MFLRFPVAFQLPTFASWAILCPLRTSTFLAVGLPAKSYDRTSMGLPCSTRARYDRVGCLLYPGSGGVL